MDYRAVLRRLLGLAASIGLAGCAVTDTTQYYTLRQAAATESAESKAIPRSGAAGTGAVGIGVGPVTMPGYLDRRQIVTRTGAGQVEISIFHRWAEPLEDGIARVLAEEVGLRIPTERIVTFPWRGAAARAIQYQVSVEVLRFDGRPGRDVTLDTRWQILGGHGDELAFRRSTVTEAADPGYDSMVAAMARALATLGQEIAAELRAVSR